MLFIDFHVINHKMSFPCGSDWGSMLQQPRDLVKQPLLLHCFRSRNRGLIWPGGGAAEWGCRLQDYGEYNRVQWVPE